MKSPQLIHRLNRSAVLRTCFATGLKITSTLLSLAFGVLVTRLLGVDSFGAYVSIFAVAGLVNVATSVGLPTLLQREFAASRGSGDRSSLKPLVQALTFINALLCVAIIITGFWGAWVLASILAFCLLSNMTGLISSLFVAHERVLLATWIGDVVRPLSALLALLALSMFAASSYLLPLFAQMIGVAAAGITLLLLWRGEPLRNAQRAFNVPWWSKRHPPIVRAGLIFGSTQLLINLTTQVDILILTAMGSAEDVAHYYAAVRAALVVNLFFSASGILAEPALTRLHSANEQKAFQSLATQTAITGAIITTIAAVFAVCLAPWYLELYGPSFAVAFPSFCIFTAGIVFRSFFGPAAPILRAIRAERSLLVISASVLVLNTAVSVVLVPLLGISGAAIGTCLQFAVFGLLLARAVRRQSKYRSDPFLSQLR